MTTNLYGAYTLCKKEIHRFMKVWIQTLLSPLISNLLFLTVFGVSLHRSIPEVQGVNFLQFLVPGLIVMGMMTNAFQNPSSSIIISKYNETVQDLLTIPLKPLEIQYAYVFAAVLRGLLVGLVTLVVSAFFVNILFSNILLIIGAAIILNLIFGLLGILIGIWANEFDKIAAIQNFIITPFIFLGGVFYSISILPDFFQKLSSLNPFAYMIDLLRGGFIGQTHFPISQSLIVMGITILVLHTLSYYAIKTGYKIKQ